MLRSSYDVKIVLRWPEECGGNNVIISIYDCYHSQSNMNFEILLPETIFHTYCVNQSLGLVKIRQILGKNGGEFI